MLLSEEEIRKWWASENGLEDCQMCKLDDFGKVARAIEAAILAKLASAELPEPAERFVFSGSDWHKAMRLAHEQGFAAGAAAQLAEKPTCWITPDGEGFRMRLTKPVTDVPLGWDALYTRREAK